MPSPFPGMDPYLEGALWTTVHFSLSAEIVRQLAPKLRPRYLVLPAERFVMETPESVAITATNMYPYVGVAKSRAMAETAQGTTVAAAPLELATIIPTPVPHVTIEIRDTANRQLVTAIEVLSPTNKRGDGREEYLGKRRRMLLSTAHLLEIDLLRQGQRVPMQSPLPRAPYFIFLSRVEKRPITEIWPIGLTEPLPAVPVPPFSLATRMRRSACNKLLPPPMICLGMIWRLITPSRQKFPCPKKTLPGPRRSYAPLGCALNHSPPAALTPPAVPVPAGEDYCPPRGSTDTWMPPGTPSPATVLTTRPMSARP